MPKAYEPQAYEDAIYKRWEESGLFSPDVCIQKGVTTAKVDPFTIVLPPPNVTGTLHMGHAAMLAIEDAMIRYHRMKGDRTLWVPGTDHAAIATQSKVEKMLFDAEKKTRHDLGREEFLKKVEKFAQESHDTIVNQAKKMGASLDWRREAFTLDEVRNRAVNTVFKNMYDDGLIYRGHRIVNWDPKLQTTVSDDEVDRKEEKTSFYYFQYGPFVIGTSRPETKFGDKYVVMHPEDERYKEFKNGQKIDVEWINGKINATIIKDEAVDMSFGTGVMTITPWHDATDFYIAERHGLDKEQVIDYDGKLLAIAGEFAGMHIKKARPLIVEKLQSKGLVVKVDEEYVHSVATNSRGGGIIEPQIKEQWFVDVNKKFEIRNSKLKDIKKGQAVTLKSLMQEVVKTRQIEILPDRFEKTYFHWIDNLRDWCISRQIWYGHRVPAWYKGEEIYVGETAPQGEGWVQDSDTLDTWFSAGLWTFSTLLNKEHEQYSTWEEWLKNSPDLKNYHPTSVLETGYDILFFWVARMILMTTYTLGEVPFKTVYLHGLVRDEQGRKMSKSLGNIIDPLDMIEKFGTDATRLSLLVGSTPGNDMKLSEEKVAGFRNFTNKLWNISRFILTQVGNKGLEIKDQVKRPKAKTLADEWILARLDEVVLHVTKDFETYQFSAAGDTLRDFTWGELADWYLEIAKIEGEKSDILSYILTTVLTLWHPFMPFVTEAIWSEMYGEKQMLIVEEWPTAKKGKPVKEFVLVKDMVTGLRALRAEYKIEPAKKLQVTISAGKHVKLLEENGHIIIGLGRLENLIIEKKAEKSASAVGFVESGIDVYVDLAGVVDTEKEKTRIEKELAIVEPYVLSLEKKLSNESFVNNAKSDVVEKEKAKLAEAKEKVVRLKEQFKKLQ